MGHRFRAYPARWGTEPQPRRVMSPARILAEGNPISLPGCFSDMICVRTEEPAVTARCHSSSGSEVMLRKTNQTSGNLAEQLWAQRKSISRVGIALLRKHFSVSCFKEVSCNQLGKRVACLL